jgi:tetratricopeptide (TPR) repeat protein
MGAACVSDRQKDGQVNLQVCQAVLDKAQVDFETAIAYMRVGKKYDKSDFDSYYEGLESVENTLASKPVCFSSEKYFELAIDVKIRLNKIDEADRLITQAYELLGRTTTLLLNHSLVESAKGNQVNSLKLLEEAKSVDPKRIDARINLCSTYSMLEKSAMAIDECTYIIDNGPKRLLMQALQERARSYAGVGDIDKAREDYETIHNLRRETDGH